MSRVSRVSRSSGRSERPVSRRAAGAAGAGSAGSAGSAPPEDVRWGTHAVEEAIRTGRVRRVLIQQDLAGRPRLAALAALARDTGVPVHLAPAAALDARAGAARHQGIVAEVAPFRYRSLHELLPAPSLGPLSVLERGNEGRERALSGESGSPGQAAEPPLLLALDGIEDPGNLGAILRSADAAGAHGVILPERRAAPVTAAAARASAGAVDYLKIAQVTNLTRALETLKERGLWVYGLDAEGEQAFDEVDYTRPLVLVAGAEGKGLSRLVRESCDVLVRIPLYGHVGSLNVSAATSLALFAARRARDRAGVVPSLAARR